MKPWSEGGGVEWERYRLLCEWIYSIEKFVTGYVFINRWPGLHHLLIPVEGLPYSPNCWLNISECVRDKAARCTTLANSLVLRFDFSVEILEICNRADRKGVQLQKNTKKTETENSDFMVFSQKNVKKGLPCRSLPYVKYIRRGWK